MGNSNELIQIWDEEENCVYLYNRVTDKWQKLADVDPKELPEAVKKLLQKMQRGTAK